ncbi:MAG: phosphotriesterase family protein [Anaerolineae bacterium]
MGRIHRRDFLIGALTLGALSACRARSVPGTKEAPMPRIHTVRGPIAPEDLGLTLAHEHIMVDWIGAEETAPQRWSADAIVPRMEPYLRDLSARGVRAFIDCTPAYLGRDVGILRQLSERTGLHILTNTGWYKQPFLPARALEAAPEAIAAEWIAEWEGGIGDTGIKPGFIKIAVHPEALAPVQRAIVRAAAQTALATGLVVACHTGHALAAQQSLDLIETEGLDPARYIIVHADQIADWDEHLSLARRGAWLEYDAIGTRTTAQDVTLVTRALEAGLQEQIMLSQDAGWYNVGEPEGGTVRPYTGLLDDFLPALAEAGVDQALRDQLLIANPARAFSVAD